MEDKFWNHFEKTGRIDSYLLYKGLKPENVNYEFSEELTED